MAVRQDATALSATQSATRERFSADPHAHQLGLALDDPAILDTLARESEAATPIYAAALRASRETGKPSALTEPAPVKPAASRPTPAQRPANQKNRKNPR